MKSIDRIDLLMKEEEEEEMLRDITERVCP